MRDLELGNYRHFKGNLYRVEAIAPDSHDCPMVVYCDPSYPLGMKHIVRHHEHDLFLYRLNVGVDGARLESLPAHDSLLEFATAWARPLSNFCESILIHEDGDRSVYVQRFTPETQPVVISEHVPLKVFPLDDGVWIAQFGAFHYKVATGKTLIESVEHWVESFQGVFDVGSDRIPYVGSTTVTGPG